MEPTADRPLLVGIGGTARPGSTTDRALRLALEAAEQAGMRAVCFGDSFLAGLPVLAPHSLGDDRPYLDGRAVGCIADPEVALQPEVVGRQVAPLASAKMEAPVLTS